MEEAGGLSEGDGELLSEDESEDEDELSKTNRVTVRLWQIEECNEGSGDDEKKEGDGGEEDEEGDEYIAMMASVRIYDDPLVSSLCGANVYDAADNDPPGPEITRPVDNIVLGLAGEPSNHTAIMTDDDSKHDVRTISTMDMLYTSALVSTCRCFSAPNRPPTCQYGLVSLNPSLACLGRGGSKLDSSSSSSLLR